MSSDALIDSNLTDLQLVSKGKVRDIYATSDPDLLLFVASDRISAYDVILRNVCPPLFYRLIEQKKLLTVFPLHMSTATPIPLPRLRPPNNTPLTLRFREIRACPTRGRS